MTEKKDDLHSLLYDLAEETIDIANSISESSEKETKEVPYLKREYVTVGEEIAGNRVIRTKEEEITKNELDQEIRREVLEKIQDEKIYSTVREIIGDRDSKINFPVGAESIISSFINSILDEFKDGISDREIARHISILTSEIDNSPIHWKPKVWILGLNLESDEVKLANNVSIRTPIEDDLIEEIQLGDDGVPGRRAIGTPDRAPTAVIEFGERAPDRNVIYDTQQNIISVLQLFDVGSVGLTKMDLDSESIIRPFPLPGKYRDPDTPFSYIISEEESEGLSQFYSNISNLVGEYLQSPDENNFLTISFDRYQNAIKEKASPESQLTSAIMSLEAMLLKDEEKGELSERLSKRADILLGMFNYQSINISNKIKTAYGIRSRYVHGSESERDYDKDLVHDIVDYTRSCIVIYLFLFEEFSKKDLLNKIDRASVQIESRESLEEDIKNIMPDESVIEQ